MTYEEALEKIHSFNVFGSRLGLERMEKLMELLGNPQEDMKIIHVAGTNGKGSVCRYMYSVLTEAGYTVGAYFSPYLERFTERIECGGQEISPQDLAVYTEKVLAQVDIMMSQGFESPTEFELVTAIGLVYFADKNADFVILEVGLGGRGDSTNICKKPLVTCIASISLDHMAQLGNTLPEIAGEKAGIIKQGVPMVFCVDDDSSADVITSRAEELNAPVIDVRESFILAMKENLTGCKFSAEFEVMDRTYEAKDIQLSMPGLHQVNNALCALHMIEVLRAEGFEIPEVSERAGMKKAVQPGRMEILSTEPYIILDGAHNPAGVEALTDTLVKYFKNQRILLCTGILKDKNYEDMVAYFCRLGADLILTNVPNPRTMDAKELEAVFRTKMMYKFADEERLKVYEDYREAVRAAQEVSEDYDLVVWAGSLYLIGAVRAMIGEK